MVTVDTIRQTVFCAVGRYEAGFYQPYRKPEHEQAAAPVGQVEEGVEILFHPLFWIALEAPPVVDVNKTARRDLRTGRVAPQFGHLLLSQQVGYGLEFVVLVFAHEIFNSDIDSDNPDDPPDLILVKACLLCYIQSCFPPTHTP